MLSPEALQAARRIAEQAPPLTEEQQALLRVVLAPACYDSLSACDFRRGRAR